MIQINSTQGINPVLFTDHNPDLNGGVTSEDIQTIAASVANEYDHLAINVKNLFEVMKKAFGALDAHSPKLCQESRKEIGADIIYNIIELNKGHDSSFLMSKALKLLINYSLDAVADETYQHRDRPLNDSVDPHQISRASIEEILSSNSSGDMIEIPRKITTKKLERVVVENEESVAKQAIEAQQYIRETLLDIDLKVNQMQEKMQLALDQVEEVKGIVVDVLENTTELSTEVRQKMILVIQDFASQVISINNEPIQAPKRKS